jgi:uroporphyrinogen-III synthase
MGLQAVVAPLFDIAAVAWDPPSSSEVDCVLLTSANAARHGGPQLDIYRNKPCFAVGESSAGAAEAAGFMDIRSGDSDGPALFRAAADAGMKRALHLCGREHIPAEDPRLQVERRIVYAAEAAPVLPETAADAIRRGAVALLHSPRSAALFRRLCEEAGLCRADIAIAALSEAVAASAGPGWKEVASAARPTDDALLELGAKLCQTGGSALGNGG